MLSRKVLSPLLLLATLVTTGFGLAPRVEAATVYNCNPDTVTTSAADTKCVIKLEEGSIGDRIRVLDEKARTVGEGRIIKRRGAYALVHVKEVTKSIRKGFPVIVISGARGSDLQWAASIAD